MKSVLTPDERSKLSSILRRGNIIPSILNHQFQSMKDDLEHTFLICNGKVHGMRGNDSTVDSTVLINDRVVDGICKKDTDRIYFHNHANFFSNPSMIDYDAFDRMFKLPNVKFACNTGIDGLFCISRNRREITIPWGSGFDNAFLQKNAKNGVEYGDALFCYRSGNDFDCNIQWRNYARSLGKFKHILMNSSTVALNDMGVGLGYYTHHPSEIIKCMITNSHKREVLVCQKIDGENIIETPEKNGKHPDPVCDVLDVCQMENLDQ